MNDVLLALPYQNDRLNNSDRRRDIWDFVEQAFNQFDKNANDIVLLQVSGPHELNKLIPTILKFYFHCAKFIKASNSFLDIFYCSFRPFPVLVCNLSYQSYLNNYSYIASIKIFCCKRICVI